MKCILSRGAAFDAIETDPQHPLNDLDITVWMNNHNHCFLKDVIIHPSTNFNGGLAKTMGG